MPKIFISYRREDSKHAVGRLHGALAKHVANPKRDIFIDSDNIPRGVDFIEHLDGQVAQCHIMLAVIGPNWLNITDPATGQRRLDDPSDFVRIEVASALKRGIPRAVALRQCWDEIVPVRSVEAAAGIEHNVSVIAGFARRDIKCEIVIAALDKLRGCR